MKFSALAAYFSSIEKTASRLEMTELLARLFTEASGIEISAICYLLQGRVGPQYESIEFGVADKFVIRAIAMAFGVELTDVVSEFKQTGDLGIAAQKLTERVKRRPDAGLTVYEVYGMLKAIAVMGGEGSQEKKIHALSELFRQSDPLSVRYLVRIPLDKLRLGFSDMTILDAFSWMVAGDKSLRVDLERAYNVRPDIGYIASMVKKDGTRGLSHVRAHFGAPILAALCQRIPTADEMIEKMGEVAVEPKYDGVRVQIHFKKSSGNAHPDVRTYSRNLEKTTDMFPELLQASDQIQSDEVILDCEAVGVDPKTGSLIPFQETMKRKRKHEISDMVKTIPLRFHVFDLLYKDGTDLLSTPMHERRRLLEKTIRTGSVLTISPQIVTDNATVLRAYHEDQLNLGLEGVVVKKWNSPYEPGRRNYSWVKFKEEEGKTGKLTDTIDAVIMGFSLGQGKRSGFGIGMFLVGVRKGDSFVSVTKIGTGVSDDQWMHLKELLTAITSETMPKQYAQVNKQYVPDTWVHPKIVVEIAGDDLTISPTHGAGIAVRFPRLVRIRHDKSPAQATTTEELRGMFEQQNRSAV